MFFRMKIVKATDLSVETYITKSESVSDALTTFAKADNLSLSKETPYYEEEKDKIVFDRITKNEFIEIKTYAGTIVL